MDSPHEISHEIKASSEKVGPDFLLQGLLHAQNCTKKVVSDFIQKLHAGDFEGFTETQARKAIMHLFTQAGVTKHWHIPFIRFGPGTVLTFNDPLQKTYTLQKNDACFIDVGPVFLDPKTGVEYEGDYGESLVYGHNEPAQKCIHAAKEIFMAAQKEWNEKKLTGLELYQFVKKRTDELGYDYVEPVLGHRISDFPHSKYARGDLGSRTFTPSASVWVFEVQIKMKNEPIGAFFEDLL